MYEKGRFSIRKDGSMVLQLYKRTYDRYKASKTIEVTSYEEAAEFCKENCITLIYRGV